MNAEQGPHAGFMAALPQVRGSIKDLETMINHWLRLMWEAASGGRMFGDRRYVFTPPFKARIVPVQSVFGKSNILPRDPFARRRRPPTLVGSKVLSKLMIFNLNSIISHFKNLAKKIRSWNIVARNKEL
jgi:hypothetical protein